MTRAGAKALGTIAAVLLLVLGTGLEAATAAPAEGSCATAPAYPPTSGDCDPGLPTTSSSAAVAAADGGLANTGADLVPTLRAACLALGVGGLVRHAAKRRQARATAAG